MRWLKRWLLSRLRERTTWASLVTAALGAIGYAASPEQREAFIALGVAIGGFVLSFFPENAPAPPVSGAGNATGDHDRGLQPGAAAPTGDDREDVPTGGEHRENPGLPPGGVKDVWRNRNR